MLTKLTIKNFKNFDDVTIDLAQTVVFIGPNNSGKTTALQALALWQTGLLNSLRKNGELAVGTINRKDLTGLPIPNIGDIWRNSLSSDFDPDGNEYPVDIEIRVSGMTRDLNWQSDMKFSYSNEESLRCWPEKHTQERSADDTLQVLSLLNLRFLPPMSGMVLEEPEIMPGRINVLVGEGQTAQILRNLALSLFEKDPESWSKIVVAIKSLFAVTLDTPERDVGRGTIVLYFSDREGNYFPLISAGRGLQQTLLLLIHLYLNPGSVLLLDEPDAHLEIIRQRQIYKLLKEVARETGSQIIAASHSEVILNEAAQQDKVIVFLGKPHELGKGRAPQVLKALKEIGFQDYYLAEQKGAVLYLEGATDLRILQAFAQKLDHPVRKFLEDCFAKYVGNTISAAESHFHGLKEAVPELKSLVILDRGDSGEREGLRVERWRKREIENYLCTKDVLLRWASIQNQSELMAGEIESFAAALRTTKRLSPWDADLKATDDFMDGLFANYFEKLGIVNQMTKGRYYELIDLMEIDEIDPEVHEKLDLIWEILGPAADP